MTIDAAYRSEHRLGDGTRVRLRLIGPADRQRLAAGFEKLSPESRYRRFLSPMPRLTEEMLRRLTDTDDWNHLAIGAELVTEEGGEGEGAGVARFIRLAAEPDAAEATVAVIDDKQNLGLGTLLLRTLITAARERDIRRFRAYVLRENAAVRAIFEELGETPVVRDEGDHLVYDVGLPEASEEEPRRSVLGRLLRLAAEGAHLFSRRLAGSDEPA